MFGQMNHHYTLARMIHQSALEEAQNERLARLAMAGNPSRLSLLQRLLIWMSGGMIALGEELRQWAGEPPCAGEPC